MNYTEFLESLKLSGFIVKGKSYAFKTFGEWTVAFIRIGGRFQLPGKICFVICARPLDAKGLEGEIVNESKNPQDYPFKLISNEIDKTLKYKSRLLDYPKEYLRTDADWSNILKFLLEDLPVRLSEIGISGLEIQLRLLKNPGYIEKIWLGENVTNK